MADEQFKKTLLISARQMKLTSTVELNADEKVLSASIFDMQNVELKATLQPDLYNYILLQVYTNKTTQQPIPADIKGLLDDYITPFLLNATLCDFIYTNQFKISNAGTEKLTGSNFQAATTQELEFAVQHYRSKKASYKKNLIEELKRRKLLSKSAETNTTENFGFYLPNDNNNGVGSTFEDEGVIVNNIIGMDFTEDTGELFLIDSGANRISTNLDGRYRLSKKIEDVINNGTFRMLQFNPATSNGCYIDYLIRHNDNCIVGRIIASWVGQTAAFTDYSAPSIGVMNSVLSFQYDEEADRFTFNITNQVNDIFIRLLVTEI